MAGAALSAAAQLSVGVLYYGIEPLRQWIRMLRNVRAVLPLLEPKLYQTHSLRTFWSMLVPWPVLSFGLYIVSAAVVLGLTIACWKRSPTVPLPSAVFGTASGERAGGAAPHGLRSGDFGARVYSAGGLADCQPLTSSTRMASELFCIWCTCSRLVGPFAQMDARPAFGDRDGGTVWLDLETSPAEAQFAAATTDGPARIAEA